MKAYAVPLLMALIMGAGLLACSPRAFDTVNKQAPPAPYWGEKHSGLDRAEYLRVKEPLE